jgi:phospholipid/cholesterol/gamma-HCH transport system permease protein
VRESLAPDLPHPNISLERADTINGRAQVRLLGRLSFDDAGFVWNQLRALRRSLKGVRALEIDLSGLYEIDGGSAALLLHLSDVLAQSGIPNSLERPTKRVNEVLELYRVEHDPNKKRRRGRRAPGVLEQIGSGFSNLLHEVQLVFAFVGQLVLSLARVFRSWRSVNWRETTATMERAGADATPIVLLINGLVGMVMAFQASPNLKQLGANIFVADLIGISVTRELGPLMTAIVVSGRSGAAFAAEFGAMRVNEEIDALRTMGLSVQRFMVLPRTIGLALMMPLLVLLADVFGILGGLVVAITTLELTPRAYFLQLQKVVSPWDVYSGLIKSTAFAAAIALIASQQGLAAEGGAEGVGKRTTSAVVATLFLLILLDAAFTVAFQALGK